MTRSRQDDNDPRARIWKRSVLTRYWLLQLAETVLLVLVLLVLKEPLGIPGWMLWVIVAAWVVKDALLYPLLWRSYDTGYPSAHTMIGVRGTAAQRIDPTGYAHVRGELWRAELASGVATMEKGEHLLVETTRDLTLVVKRPERA